MSHKTAIHLFLLRNMLRKGSSRKHRLLRYFTKTQSSAGFDLYGECSWKIENQLMLFTRWKSWYGHLCYTVENSEVFTCKENLFGVAFNRCLKDTIFLCGLLFQKLTLHRTARTSIYQRNAQELTKEQL